jgi:crotonobetainyl-CoA:carnitine CoA-transferase CaiB-like acyl-CoA transferase
VERWSAERDGAEAEATILAAGCPCSEYKTVRASQTDPHVAYRGSAATVDDGSGPFEVPNTPFQSSSTRTQASDWVASLGEHTEETLREFGYAEDVIVDWRERGIFRAST